jgi:hypothetical protein
MRNAGWRRTVSQSPLARSRLPNIDPAALVHAEWQATPISTSNAVDVHFQTAGFLKAAGGKNTDYIGVWVLTGSERIRPWIWKSRLQFRDGLAG